MKTAFICCIHGNLQALEAVGADIAAQKADRVFCLGDVVGYGANPHECVDYVQTRKWPVLMGNHEAAIIDPAIADDFNPMAKLTLYYTMGALNKNDRAWIRTLPATLEEAGFQLAHGFPAPTPETWRRYVITTDDAAAAFALATRKWLFVGHTHRSIAFFKTDPISYSRESICKLDRNTPAIVNVGSVGQPRDKDPRACYAILDEATGQVELRRVTYDVARAVEEMKDAGLPLKMAERLLTGI